VLKDLVVTFALGILCMINLGETCVFKYCVAMRFGVRSLPPGWSLLEVPKL
jgi:hypothetical protein